jgi:hypothetical protein
MDKTRELGISDLVFKDSGRQRRNKFEEIPMRTFQKMSIDTWEQQRTSKKRGKCHFRLTSYISGNEGFPTFMFRPENSQK